ncbi:MAG: hypothetical protein JNK94_05450 [Hyphomonadaceae bacterium]|nr:hypothetical protein [Hyphomonadaceae bacterium]MBX3511573.1 hypothetical protein [Hyphomonadaceae bacterium]
MNFEDLFRQFWWLIFPVFGMVMAVLGTISSDRRTRRTIDLIKSYVDQGKEPPPELLQLALKEEDGDDWGMGAGRGTGNSRAWTFVILLAIAAGFGTGYWWARGEDYAFAFLIVTVTMSVLAVGALMILLFGRK